ncbi:MAG: hypothetical protein ACYS47_19190 [Planctomycetota bacterium]|jgi:hypothetical protein
MTRINRFRALVLAALILGTAGAAFAGQANLEARHIAYQLEQIRGRLPKIVHEELEAYTRRWVSLAPDDRLFIEKCIFLLEAMLPHQIRELFKEVARAEGDDKRKEAKDALASLAGGGEVPAAASEPSVVVVIMGGDVNDAKLGFGDSKKTNLPRIWNQIRPFGAFVPAVKTMWIADRTQWIGEFLTGISVKGLDRDGAVWKFKLPTFMDLFRKISNVEARDSWLVTRGETQNIVFDFLEFNRNFEDKFKPTAVTGAKLRGIDGYVQDHILSQRKNGKTSYEIQRGLSTSLTPGKLHLDVDFDNVDVQKFLRDVIAEHGGQITDSDAFTVRLGVRLLQDPVMAPRLAVFRLGGIPGIREMKIGKAKRELMGKKIRDDDEAVYNLWRAFRANPYYRNFGTFIIVNELSGVVAVGPKINRIQTSKSYILNQMASTIATLLGYDPKEFFRPQGGGIKAKKPIKEIIAE